MKQLLLILGLTILSLNSFAKAPACFNDAGVSAEQPYLLTLKKVGEFQLDLITEELLSHDLITGAEAVFNIDGLVILALGVDAVEVAIVKDGPSDVDQRIYKISKAIAKKYKVRAKLECNGVTTGKPRSGGGN